MQPPSPFNWPTKVETELKKVRRWAAMKLEVEKLCPLTPPRRSIDLVNWNGIEGGTPDGSPRAWGGVLAGCDRIPSETHCPWGPFRGLPSFPSLFVTVIYGRHSLWLVLTEYLLDTLHMSWSKSLLVEPMIRIVCFGQKQKCIFMTSTNK